MDQKRLVLLGDSILDNASYTDPDPDTTTHLQRLLAERWSVTRLALDGAVMADVGDQLNEIDGRPDVGKAISCPEPCPELCLSYGGGSTTDKAPDKAPDKGGRTAGCPDLCSELCLSFGERTAPRNAGGQTPLKGTHDPLRQRLLRRDRLRDGRFRS
jgi:hypothetical protein